MAIWAFPDPDKTTLLYWIRISIWNAWKEAPSTFLWWNHCPHSVFVDRNMINRISLMWPGPIGTDPDGASPKNGFGSAIQLWIGRMGHKKTVFSYWFQEVHMTIVKSAPKFQPENYFTNSKFAWSPKNHFFEQNFFWVPFLIKSCVHFEISMKRRIFDTHHST